MATSWRSCVIVATDVEGLASFWQRASGLEIAFAKPDEVVLTEGGQASRHPGLVIMSGDKSNGSVLHLDLNSDDIDRDSSDLVDSGATLVADHGDEWKMFKDPEGNLFCVRRVESSSPDL